MVDAVQAARTGAGAITRFLNLKLGRASAKDGKGIEADAIIEDSPTVLFDGVIVPNAPGALARSGQVASFFRISFGIVDRSG
jgi:catalase